jgi:hypothetical protein
VTKGCKAWSYGKEDTAYEILQKVCQLKDSTYEDDKWETDGDEGLVTGTKSCSQGDTNKHDYPTCQNIFIETELVDYSSPHI